MTRSTNAATRRHAHVNCENAGMNAESKTEIRAILIPEPMQVLRVTAAHMISI